MTVTPLSESEVWLKKEDSTCFPDRLERLNWLASKLPIAEYWIFPGGLISKYSFEEARYSFVYGQYLATVVLGLSYIERTLAALFYGAGRDELERASLAVLLQEARNLGWLDEKEFDNLQRAREIRNPITHFRRPGHVETVEYRAAAQEELPYNILEEDARHVMEAALAVLTKRSA